MAKSDKASVSENVLSGISLFLWVIAGVCVIAGLVAHRPEDASSLFSVASHLVVLIIAITIVGCYTALSDIRELLHKKQRAP